MLTKNEIIGLIKDYLLKRDEIIFAYIFGSFVKKENYHDIDIAVFINEQFDYKNPDYFSYGYESKIIGELTLLVRKNIDFVILNDASLTLKKNIIKNNILIIDKNKSKRINFENLVRKMFLDSENLRKIKQNILLKKLENG